MNGMPRITCFVFTSPSVESQAVSHGDEGPADRGTIGPSARCRRAYPVQMREIS